MKKTLFLLAALVASLPLDAEVPADDEPDRCCSDYSLCSLFSLASLSKSDLWSCPSSVAVPPAAKSYVSNAVDDGTGLEVFINAGLFIPSAKQANFYSGRPENANTIERVLFSDTYGRQIWESLVNSGYLRGVGNYSEMQLADYPDMYYKLGYQIGFGLRYGYKHGWGWLARFDYSQLTAAGAFHIYNGPQASVLTNRDRYVTCAMYGLENRINIDIALTKRFPIDNDWQIEGDIGFNLNNTKVKENKMEINGAYYSILDVWNGRRPDSGVGSYDYVNQGGIGVGGFVTLSFAYVMANRGSLELGYTCYYTQTRYKGYNDADAFAFQHAVFVRANLYNFSFK